ncbi:MAG TPA: glycoside hydrolase family 13 protein [Ktedonobacterales bacterium]
MHDLAVWHIPRPPYAYPLADERLNVRLRVAKDDLRRPTIEWSDRQAWTRPNEETPMRWFADDAQFRYWEATITPSEGRVRYLFRLEDSTGQAAPVYFGGWGLTRERPQGAWPDGYVHWPYIHRERFVTTPAWVRDAICYQIFPDRFARGNPPVAPDLAAGWTGQISHRSFWGGDLRGVIAHLDHVASVGANLIWFTPIFQATTNHKYDTTDYGRIDPHFGDDEVFNRLIAESRARGIRVILDGVFNHSGSQFAPWRDVLEHGMASPYWGWFDVTDEPADPKLRNYRTFAKAPHMPRLMTGNPEVQAYLFERASRWMRMGIAGWRLDVADEVDSSFWRAFRRDMRAINPEAYFVGEISYDAVRWLEGDQFDGVMNYPVLHAALRFVAPPENGGTTSAPLDASGFLDAVSQIRTWYPGWANTAALNALSTHDIPRFLTEMGGDVDRFLLGLTFMMTYEGIPMIYYGDEVGMEGGADPDNRRPMIWEPERQNHRLLEQVRALTRLRRERPALRGSGFRPIRLAKPSVAAYLRGVSGLEELPREGGSAEQGSVALVLLNTSKEPVTVEVSQRDLSQPEAFGAITWPASERVAYEPLTRKAHALTDTGLSVTLPALGSMVLTPNE